MKYKYSKFSEEFVEQNYFKWLKNIPHRTCECYAKAPMPITLYKVKSEKQTDRGFVFDMLCGDCIEYKEENNPDWALGLYAPPYTFFSEKFGRNITLKY